MKTIETERLLLRRFNIDDIESVCNLITDDEKLSKSFYRYSRNDNEYVKSYKEEIKRQNRKKYLFDWLMVIKDTNMPIGRIFVYDYSTRKNHCEIHYWYGEEFANNGYSKEALEAVIDFIFKETNNIKKIYAVDEITGEEIETEEYPFVKKDDMLCPVCGKYHFVDKYDICPICGWECDPIQNKDKDYKGGANKLSLNEARKVYHEKKQ